jgi:hypothetical protein
MLLMFNGCMRPAPAAPPPCCCTLPAPQHRGDTTCWLHLGELQEAGAAALAQLLQRMRALRSQLAEAGWVHGPYHADAGLWCHLHMVDMAESK